MTGQEQKKSLLTIELFQRWDLCVDPENKQQLT